MKNKLNIAAIRELHQAGKLDEAKSGYLSILKSNPKDVDALHSLAILSVQQDDMQRAMEYVQSALKLQPDNPVLCLHLANILKIQGLFSQSADVLKKIITLDPDCISAYNNLGSVYYAQKKFPDAIQAYRQALAKQPDFVDAHYNLGLALNKNNEPDAAINVYEYLLQHVPSHFAARFHLACLLMQQEKIIDAEKQFLLIEAEHPFHFETQTNLATCYLKLGALNEARKYYLNALTLAPQDTQILFNLGVIDVQLGNLDHAIQHYQRAVQIDPDYFEAHNNLGAAFILKQHAGFALHHFQEALRLHPNNKAIQYTVQALSKNQLLLAAPPDYITTLFDAYADHYDAHLTKALDYKIPELLYEAVSEVTSIPNKQWDILDLGCGTGLCGTPFKSAAKKLVGVDLSTKMLAVAAEKHIYDELISQDLITFFAENHSQYDLILAGDLFVYIGDLAAIFPAISASLRKTGHFAFNTEISDDEKFKMNQSGRFAHHKNYIEQLAKEHHLSIVFYKIQTTRMQNNEPVEGHIFVMTAQ